jgi:alpha-galactosidase
MFVVAIVAMAALATDMDHKGRVIATVQTKNAGVAEVTCNDPGGWKFAVSASEDAGRDVVTVRMSSPTNAQPPQFGVFFRVPGAGVQNVWTSDFESDGCHVWPQLWWGWKAKYKSQLARDAPIAVGFNSCERAPVALVCSEAFNALEFGLYADDRTCEMVGRCEFFTAPVAPLREYEVSVMLDRRGGDFADTVRQCKEWIAAKNGFRTAYAPESAFDPLYSTWYAYLQDVHAGELEEEARLAASLGMKTMILDDGWQKVDSRTFYSATGDWMPVPSRFPDMKAHVDAVHKAGLKYMLWLAVPFMGNEAKNYPRFKDMLLTKGDTGILDPRFPEVREYLISTYERVVGEWGFDGVKLDFIDSFVLPKNDPAVKDDYAGRDYRSLPDAVDRLMKDVLTRLKKINPDVLVEFRQHYMGPAILQYGNMMRCADCPADPTANRKRICDLRLTSEGIAVHSDMLVWSKDETPEGAALPILNALFSTIQYSMVLAKVSPEHRKVIASWIRFSQEHRKALLRGAFRPHHAENGYAWIEGESEGERIVAVYANDVCARTGVADRPVFIVNATGGRGALVEFAADARVEFFDVFGKPTGVTSVAKGVSRLDIPASGFAKVAW